MPSKCSNCLDEILEGGNGTDTVVRRCELDGLKSLEGLLATFTEIIALAGSRTELTRYGGMERIAERASNLLRPVGKRDERLLCGGSRRRDSIGFQLCFC